MLRGAASVAQSSPRIGGRAYIRPPTAPSMPFPGTSRICSRNCPVGKQRGDGAEAGCRENFANAAAASFGHPVR